MGVGFSSPSSSSSSSSFTEGERRRRRLWLASAFNTCCTRHSSVLIRVKQEEEEGVALDHRVPFFSSSPVPSWALRGIRVGALCWSSLVPGRGRRWRGVANEGRSSTSN